MADTTIQFDTNTQRALDDYIKSHFPDASTNDHIRTGIALALWTDQRGGQRSKVDLSAYDAQLSALAAQHDLQADDDARRVTPTDGFRYYDVDATHARTIPELEPFVGHLSMVRVTLPEKNSGVKDFHTSLGTVAVGDHLYRSVEEFKKTYPDEPYKRATRLDLVTPARELGMRFGAISVYLGYVDHQQLPGFYILEAGTATGDPKVPFISPTIDGKIVAYADYQPTPFTKKTNVYRGSLTLDGDKPLVMAMTSESTKDHPYIHLTVKFTETKTPRNIWPGFLLARAALIVELRKGKVPTT